MKTKEKADALIKMYRPYANCTIGYTQLKEYELLQNAAICAIKSVEHTIEVLNKILAHDKERYGIISRGATIELDEQTELLTELKSRI